MSRVLLFLLCQACVYAQFERPLLDCHNCYPEGERYRDRIDRALRLGYPIGIEQDLALRADGIPVVVHGKEAKGGEPTLREHFFERVRPIVEQALKDNRRGTWPLIVLHFDFKSLDPRLLRAVWDLLGEYEGWITTAPKLADASVLTPFDRKPVLVMTEDADIGEEIFYTRLPVGEKLRLFGSAHTHKQRTTKLSPAELLSEKPTNFRRWWNNAWGVVEEGGQRKAGEWTAEGNARLQALVDHAHKLGFWIRFYTLDGFTAAENQGWGEGYSFGSRKAVEARWKAALEAGVDMIATDQMEDFAAYRKSLETK